MTMKLQMTLVVEWPVEKLEHYKADSLADAAARTQQDIDDGCIALVDVLDWATKVTATVTPVAAPAYSLCVTPFEETEWARSHIRQLTNRGPRYDYGTDTDALCGRRTARDLEVGITDLSIKNSCPSCVAAYKKAQKENPNEQ